MPKSKLIQIENSHNAPQQRVTLASSPSTLSSIVQTMSTGVPTACSPMSALSAPPRKVSFEDGHSDDGASSCSGREEEGILPLHRKQQQDQQAHGEATKEVRLSRSSNNSSPHTNTKKPRLLARHSPSLSLVDLARTVGDMDSDYSMVTGGLSGGEESSSSRTKKRPHSAPVSPVSGVIVDPSRCLFTSTNQRHPLLGGMESSAEPWGHFVDMALPEKKKLRTVVPKTIPLSERTLKHTHNRKRHHRRKYANPYGEYHHTKLCFQPTTKSESFSLDLLPIPSGEDTFSLLKPRNIIKEPTEQITGDLQRLHFDSH